MYIFWEKSWEGARNQSGPHLVVYDVFLCSCVRGEFSTVVKGKHKETGEEWAIKCIEKHQVILLVPPPSSV